MSALREWTIHERLQSPLYGNNDVLLAEVFSYREALSLVAVTHSHQAAEVFLEQHPSLHGRRRNGGTEDQI